MRMTLQQVLEHQSRLEASSRRDKTVVESTPKPKVAIESDLHEKVEDYCRERGWWYLHSRMDRKTTVGVGTPDFCIARHGGRMVFMELKRTGGKATAAQLANLAHLRHLGHVAEVVDNWEDCLRLMS